jgi:integrase
LGCSSSIQCFHDLRHTYATGALKAGVSPKVVSQRIGHANVGFFL